MALEFTTSYLQDATEVFRYYKGLGDRAMEESPDEGLFAALDAESKAHFDTLCAHLRRCGPASTGLPPDYPAQPAGSD